MSSPARAFLEPDGRYSNANLRLYSQSVTFRMKDIADDLGLSVVTVSKVLRNHPDIGEETRKRVLKRVKELDYQPNLMARSLVTGRSYLVGLVVPNLLHPFYAEVAKSLSVAIRKNGYSFIIIRQLLARRLDALVIASMGFGGSPLGDVRLDH